ncbi:MAG: low temperature requirement protein A [Segniliparus sp.]|uniref:low temperature requirement protein A n=1 Tax=Segniliparus sp. TaxID=2804064 RepID=UPI003F38333E
MGLPFLPRPRRMTARDPGEEHRVSTPLELLFDLCFVVAVAGAATLLHHQLSEGHWEHGVLVYGQLFFAIWWGWLNFSWFASAYDVDDLVYRLTAMVQIAGSLVLAAAVYLPEATRESVMIAGYVLMRLAMVSQWLRAAASDPEHRATALRYAVGITLVQAFWVGALFLPGGPFGPVCFLLGAAFELAIPALAEWKSATPWHPHHIAERYGLFTIIVLGEAVASSATAIREGVVEERAASVELTLAGSALVILFAMWWIYFERPVHNRLTGFGPALTWGFGHYWIYASGAAVGAGIGVLSERLSHHEHNLLSGLALTLPVAVYVLGVWLLQFERSTVPRFVSASFPAVAALVLASAFTPWPEVLTAVLMAALVLLLTTACAPQSHEARAVGE